MEHNMTSHLYLQIAESIRRQIVHGELQPGDRLPSIRETASTWRCTPGTAARAYQILTDDGLVTSHRGQGTMIAHGPLRPQAPGVNWAILVNRAERFLLENLAAGYSIPAVEIALTLAIDRYNAMQVVDATKEIAVTPTSEFMLFYAGSHDPLIELLRKMLNQHQPAIQLIPEYIGSLGGLMALARGDADLVGTHLWDESSDSYNLPYLRRILPGSHLLLVRLAQRQIGLILPKGNPQHVQSVADLGKPGVIFVNRQRGSGTRVWLDRQLLHAGIAASQVIGYEREATTHNGVVDAIASGLATAGIGLCAVAASMGLDYLPLVKENFDLVLHRMSWEATAVRVLVDLLRSPALREQVRELVGYDLASMGEVTHLQT
jgi:putative molybdopterin biosynthesis protein